MATIKDVLVKFGFKADVGDLNKIKDSIEGVKHRLDTMLAVQLASRLIEMSKQFGEFAEHLRQASISAGLTVEAFQKMTFAGAQSGVEANELAVGMAKLSKHLYDARNGSEEAQKAFMKAGFSSAQIQGFRTGSDALLALSDRFANIQDPVQKQALAMELLGRGGYKMVGFLSQGSAAIKEQGKEAQRLGIILKDWQVESLEKLENSFKKLAMAIKTGTAIFLSYLAPAIKFIIDRMLEFRAANLKVMGDSNMEKWAHRLAYAIGFVYGILEQLTQEVINFFSEMTNGENWDYITKVLRMFGDYWGVIFTVMKNGFGFIFDVFKEMSAALDRFIDSIYQVWSALTSFDFNDSWLSQAWDILKKAGGAIGNMIGMIPGVAGLSVLQDRINGPAQAPSNLGQGAVAGANYAMQAAITVNVPPGADAQGMAESVKSAVKEHLDGVHRETNRSVRGAVAY